MTPRTTRRLTVALRTAAAFALSLIALRLFGVHEITGRVLLALVLLVLAGAILEGNKKINGSLLLKKLHPQDNNTATYEVFRNGVKGKKPVSYKEAVDFLYACGLTNEDQIDSILENGFPFSIDDGEIHFSRIKPAGL